MSWFWTGMVPQLGPPTWSLNLVPKLDPPTWSFNLVPQLGPSTWSLNLVPSSVASFFHKKGKRQQMMECFFLNP